MRLRCTMSSAAEDGDSPRSHRPMVGLKGGSSEDKRTASKKFPASGRTDHANSLVIIELLG